MVLASAWVSASGLAWEQEALELVWEREALELELVSERELASVSVSEWESPLVSALAWEFRRR